MKLETFPFVTFILFIFGHVRTKEANAVESHNRIELQIAGTPIILQMGPDDEASRRTWPTGRHNNDEFEVHILLAGSCELEVGNQTINFPQSKAVLIAPGTFHGPRNLSEDFERFCFSFVPTRQEFSQQLIDQVRTASICNLPPVAASICKIILGELSGEYPYSEDIIRALFVQLLVIIFRRTHLEFSRQAIPSNTAAWRTATIDAFFSPMPDNFGTEDELAAMLNLSRRQLNRVLIRNYGMGFRQKMLQTRMEYAGNLLRSTDQKISQVGIEVGYTAESSFYKAFQSYYGMTPQQYRNAHTQKDNSHHSGKE